MNAAINHAAAAYMAKAINMRAGRAILAFLPAETLSELASFLKQELGEEPAPDEWSAMQKSMKIALESGVHAEALQMSPGFSAIAIPVRDQIGTAIACIIINGPVYPSKNIRAQLEIRDGLERLIAATPKRFVSPFAHIPAHKMRLQIPRTKSAVGTAGKLALQL